MRPLLSGLIVILLLTGGCATDRSRIDMAVTHCCATPAYKTFSVRAEHIPFFLGPLMVSNFSVAFAGTGMHIVEDHADMNVVLRFEQINEDTHETTDDFTGSTGGAGNMRFIARIIVDMHDAKTGKIVWSGYIQRLHDVAPGDYMHTGAASEAILDAFVRLLKHYPG